MFESLKKKFSDFVNSVSRKEQEEEKKEEKIEKTETEIRSIEEAEKKIIEEQKYKAKTEVTSEAGHGGITEAKPKPEQDVWREAYAVQKTKKKASPSISFSSKVKGALLGEIKLSDSDIAPFVEQLKLDLLKSDVNYDVVEKIASNVEKNLTAAKFNAKSARDEISSSIRDSLKHMLEKGNKVDIIELGKSKKSKGELLKVLFIGPNGAGKTTTIAKVANLLIGNGISCILSASDTFRAAAIEQTSFHASKLGIEVIKGTYGSDPSSVAFDAIAHAKAAHIDCVLIDTAGRQETNKSLLEEVKKMDRVNKPDLKIFVGEGVAGNALLEQVKQFNEAVKLDGIILTKLDCDAKGGNTLSILSDTNVPVLFFGTGEKYTDIMPYDVDFIVNNIVA